MPKVFRIGLTGGIGSGKSTVSSKFHELGVPIIDTDEISRDIVQPDSPCLKKITELFGIEVLTESGKLDRKRLRTIIFNNNNAKSNLEGILHPAIYKEIEKRVSAVKYPYCIIVIPLLIETNAMDQVDRILVVATSKKAQLDRASQRDNMSPKSIEKIIQRQATNEERLKHADDVINNNLTIEELSDSVTKLHEKYLNLSSHND